MFWKKKPKDETTGSTKPEKKKKISESALRKIDLEDQINKLSPGDTISFGIKDMYGGGLAILQLNADFPGEGRKYSMFTEGVVNGKSTGKRSILWSINKLKDVVDWLEDRVHGSFVGRINCPTQPEEWAGVPNSY